MLATFISFQLAAWTDALLLHHAVLSPGMYVWRWFHPMPQPGFSGPWSRSFLLTIIIIDGGCWLLLVCGTGFAIERAVRRNKSSDSISTATS
jgi:hypothetical protein